MTEDIYRDPTTEELAEQAEWEATAYERAVAEVDRNRQAAYQLESDPLYFKWQAGEGTEDAWKAKRDEIRERYPMPEAE